MERSKAREIVARGAPSPDKSGLKQFIIEICPVKCSNPKGTGCFKTYFYLFMYPFTWLPPSLVCRRFLTFLLFL